MTRAALMMACALFGVAACSPPGRTPAAADGGHAGAKGGPAGADGSTSGATPTIPGARFPLTLVADVPLPGKPVRFDYEDIDRARGHLIIAHMNDASVIVANLGDGSVQKVLPNIPTARGVVVADDVGRIFVTSSPHTLVIIDNASLAEIARVDTGNGPDGVAWDPADRIVGVSDQADGAVSLLHDAGSGARTRVPLGAETGNVVFDATRRRFWVTVVTSKPPDQLVAIDPVGAAVTTRIDLPGCSGAHGLRIHPDGASALVACEENDMVVRVDLGGSHALVSAKTGAGADVLSVDSGLGWLYVAAESGDLTVFDIGQPGLVNIDREHPGDNAHSVVVDPATHRVFFPLMVGPKGAPVLRIMRPSGVD